MRLQGCALLAFGAYRFDMAYDRDRMLVKIHDAGLSGMCVFDIFEAL